MKAHDFHVVQTVILADFLQLLLAVCAGRDDIFRPRCPNLIGLTLTEFWLVHALARYPGHVKNRQQLMDAAQAVLDDNTITSHIKRIRRKFHAIDADFNAIETVYGMGYRWLGD